MFITSLFPLERFVTPWTRIGLDTGMYAHVSLQGGSLPETTTTLLTGESSLAGMNDLVVFEGLASLEPDATHVTAVLPHFCVHDTLVHSDSSGVGVTLAADIAVDWTSGVHPLV